MNETKQIVTLESLAEVAKAREQRRRTPRLASIRVSPGAYLAAASVLTFASVLLLRSQKDMWALIAIGLAWLVVPALAFADRIAFDGESLHRQGPVPFLLQLVSGRRQKLSVGDFERVDTNAVRTLRRGGRVRYRYRTQIVGKNTVFAFASGGRKFREMARLLFPVIHDDKIDIRTRELRDYLCDPQKLTREVEAMQLASPQVLDNVDVHFKIGRKTAPDGKSSQPSAHELDRAAHLRLLGNRLRIAGRLREGQEAFRRALNVIPKDAWLIYELARLLRSQASALGDARLFSRARAALRLAAIRAGMDTRLLSLIGESLLECGEPERAQRTFQRAIDDHAIDIVRRNIRFIAEFLLDGELVRHGLLDPVALRTALGGEMTELHTDTLEILDHVQTEAWLRLWTGVSAAPPRPVSVASVES